ncbi:hypothetical protein KC332_g7365 [Hortaea werneckii]|uniref:Myb-like domain-containing protein n=1 Tax=Hortaea werneckii TaxID=91943 RepID=A0A3M7I7X2_HORWE|nr:hypothetical protein KC329_g7296 [Hortaea werneckii]KAI7271762.1 hypothetical protein KC335_g4687 [Hortaea werneckii]KAI7408877.1 hypothetical protein KC332_g7365 [Hortaea werneckii]KAI7447489.1 hypothetical protein KC368_g6463 [Hortaea werneckii]RMZ21492.1 hypothetical protein D0859_14492 [Hortaea werneckii]
MENPLSESTEFEQAEQSPGAPQNPSGERHFTPEGEETREPIATSGVRRRKSRNPNFGLGQASGGPYRALLNTAIQDVQEQTDHNSTSLLPSYVGASLWTTDEKEAFFAALIRFEAGDVRRIANAVKTKSETEVQVYLQLLQEGLTEAEATAKGTANLPMSEIPAAFEVSEEFEERLDQDAQLLATKVNDHDEERERSKYGNDWLIDESFAAAIEEDLEKDEKLKIERNDEAEGQEAVSARRRPLSSVELLHPHAFLTLSRTLFMNVPAVSGTSWHGFKNESLTDPGIFHTAFDDMHSLVVSHTRRLVQAAVFQATTRLRASGASRSKWAPKPEVTATDVQAVLNTLQKPTSWQSYWAKVPRRLGLGVYTDSKDYRDGRPGTKVGVKLTYREVEAELGIESFEIEDEAADDLSPDEDDYGTDEFTDFSDEGDRSDADDETDKLGPDDIDENDEIPKFDNTEMKHEPRENDETQLTGNKRKRALSPASFARAETEYLEDLDQRASNIEEARLCEWLQISPPAKRSGRPEGQLTAPSLPRSERNLQSDWRRKLDYQAEWEYFADGIPKSAFTQMQQHGEHGRKKRKVLAERLRREAVEDCNPPAQLDSPSPNHSDRSSSNS